MPGAATPVPDEVRASVVRVCRRLHARGLIAGQDGNVSLRVAPDRILVTPAGASKCDVEGSDLVELDLEGRAIAGAHLPSSEVGMHLFIYRRRPDVRAIVHAHPPMATAFSLAGEPLPRGMLPELTYQLGDVPLVPYATPGTPALAESLAPVVDDADAFLLSHHGATTVGPTLTIAHQRMESLEHAAQILWAARMLGRLTPLAPREVQALIDARRRAWPGAGESGDSVSPV